MAYFWGVYKGETSYILASGDINLTEKGRKLFIPHPPNPSVPEKSPLWVFWSYEAALEKWRALQTEESS